MTPPYCMHGASGGVYPRRKTVNPAGINPAARQTLRETEKGTFKAPSGTLNVPCPFSQDSQLLEQRPGDAAAVLWRALQVGETLFQDRRFLRVGLADLRDDLLERDLFTAHGHAVGVVVQDHLGLLDAALRLDRDRRRLFSAAA